jgi:hypothetical protein
MGAYQVRVDPGRAVLRVTTSTILVALALPANVAPAQDDTSTDGCPPGYFFEGSGCEAIVPSSDGDEGSDDYLTGCAQNDPAVAPAPCAHNDFVLYEEHDRYLRQLSADENELHRPPDGTLSYLGYWTGPPDEGWMYEWRKLSAWEGALSVDWGAYGFMWLAEEPGGLGVDVEALAQSVLDGMDLQPVEIGMAPTPIEQAPESIGLVGAPNWLWVNNPGPATWGPITETGSQAGVTVTVTAKVKNVTWNLGDGTVVTCDSPGHPYRRSYGVRESPSCGHTYFQTSSEQPNQAYTVTATTNWTAEWEASTGASGTLDVAPLSSSVHVRIGERQLIEQPTTPG